MTKIPLPEACRRSGCSIRSAMRWIASKRLKTRGKVKLKSGQQAWLVHLEDVARIKSANARSVPAWKKFENACLAKNCKPDSVLHQISTADADLLAHSLRLATDGKSDFLLYLSKQKRLDRSFAAQIAKLHGTHSQLCVGQSDGVTKTERTQDVWRYFRIGTIYGPYSFSGTPDYLRKNAIKNAPEWAKIAVRPLKKSVKANRVFSMMEKLDSLAAKDAELKGLLEFIFSLLESPSNFDSLVNRRETIDECVNYLVQYFNLKHSEAKKFCYDSIRVVNSEKTQDLSEHSKGRRKTSRAELNRIFGLSRAAKLPH